MRRMSHAIRPKNKKPGELVSFRVLGNVRRCSPDILVVVQGQNSADFIFKISGIVPRRALDTLLHTPKTGVSAKCCF